VAHVVTRWWAVGVIVVVGACSGSSHASAPRATAPASTAASTVAPETSTTTVPSEPGQRMEASLPLAIQESAAAVANDHLYVVGGYDTARNSTDVVFVYDGSAWTRGPALPIRVNHPGAAAIGNDVYVAGGFTPSGATNRVFVLARGATAWRELSSLQRARGAIALLSLGGALYAIGGRDGARQIAVPERYDPARNAWTDLPPMPSPRNHLAGYVSGGQACVAGGRVPSTSAAIDCFQPEGAKWVAGPMLAVATSGAAAADFGNALIVAGGEPAFEGNLVTVVQKRRDAAWTTQPMLVPRHGTGFALFHGRLWMCGGATAPGFQATASCTSLKAAP
jgi:Kelch motif